MDFGILGPVEVSRDGASVRIGSRMQRRLLALLLVHAGDFVGAERVIDVLWGDEPPPSAPRGLHTYMSRLRGVLGAGVEIESDAHGYRLRLDDHELDARRFEQLVAAARERLADGPEQAAARLGEALALWRGPAYAEFAQEDFARPEAVRLDELRLAATEDRFAARIGCGDPRIVPDLDAFAAANPLRERPHVQLMHALGQTGRPVEALEVFQRMRLRLADEVGLDPSPALRQAQADILQQAPSMTHVAADGDGRDRVEAAPGNLPRPVTSFVGRRHETEAVCRLLQRDRLVTLTGVGGVGKTRLALQAAAVGEYPDGVWWCELAPADPDAVGHTVAEVLGVQQQADRSIAESIVGALAGKRLLLALDNCEHVAAASAHLAEQILRRCGEVTILATSRQPLAADGEQVWVVPPLPLPSDRAGGTEAPSTRLFCDRASAHRADFTADEATRAAVADVCRQLDGLPLAIELAAALVPAFEPAQIVERLGHRFRLLTHGPRSESRHRSLAAAVEWSYQLLDAAEQRLFDRLAVFAGGFTLATAEGVCADKDLAPERVAGLMAGLVTRSMVAVDRSATPARYHLLETLRQYGNQRLVERGEEPAVRARHAAWFVDLAEAADADVRGPGEAEAVALLEAELSNLRAAHRFAVARDDAGLALRLVAALYVFAFHRLRDEVFVWAEQAAGLPSAGGHPLQPTVWGVAANGMSNRGELASARALAERALAAAPHPTALELFAAWHALGVTALYEGRLDDCRSHARESLASAGPESDAYYPVIAGVHDALALIYGGRREAGAAAATALRTGADASGNPTLRAWSRYTSAEACGDDDPEQALVWLEDAINLAEPVRGRFLEGVARHAIIALRARHHDAREALRSFPDVLEHWRRAGNWTHQWTALRTLLPLLVRLGADEPAALLHGAQGAAGTAAPTYGADADRLAEASQTLSERLDATAFGTLVAQGRQLSGPEAVDVATAAIAELLDT